METFTYEDKMFFVWRKDQIEALSVPFGRFEAITLDSDGTAQIVSAYEVLLSGMPAYRAEYLGTFHVAVYEAYLTDCVRRSAWKIIQAERHATAGCYELSDSGEMADMCGKYCIRRPNHNAHQLSYDELTEAEECNLRTIIEIIKYRRARILKGNRGY